MRILVLNSGSSTVKFALGEVPGGASHPRFERLATGVVQQIGAGATFQAHGDLAEGKPRPVHAENHREAISVVFNWLCSRPVETAGPHPAGIHGVGHRVVHGGRFLSPTRLDEAVLAELAALNELAPLHNPAALEGIRAAGEFLGSRVPMVAVFDTAFHSTLPDRASAYALPADLTRKLGIRRFGFHGLAHESMLEQYAAFIGAPREGCTLITLQLGNGCSVTAIADGRSVDTSMGFTPLEGLVMGTRSGDLDPGLVTYLARKLGFPSTELDRCLNEQSGLLGLSGLSGDMRDLLNAADGNPQAALAIEVFCYRARKYLGAYLAALDGADAVVFAGGIGEQAPEIRRRICEGMEWCGLRLDLAANQAVRGSAGRISTEDARIHAYVFPVDEAELIACRTADCIHDTVSPGPA